MIYSPSLEIGNSRDFGEIRDQVHRLVAQIDPGHDLTAIDHAFALLEVASDGLLLGYSRLLTPYHDQGHMLEVVLCSVRLLHGVKLAGQPVDALMIDACLIGALLHDSGYLMCVGEQSGTGAQFTATHVQRGVIFAETHLADRLSPALLTATCKVILSTDHRPIATLPTFDNDSQRLAARIAATADIIAQMANREYLERLFLLFCEFREAGIQLFADANDLLEKTGGFYQFMSGRLNGDLGNMAPFLTHHFAQTRNDPRNFYTDSVARNLDHLSRVLQESGERRIEHLRRGQIIDQALQLLGK